MKSIQKLIKLASEESDVGDKAFVELVSLQKEAFDPVINALKNSEDSQRLQQIVIQIRDPEIIPSLIALLTDGNDVIREISLDSLSLFKDQSALPSLIKLLENGDDYSILQQYVVQTLGTIIDPTVQKKLLDLAKKYITNFSSEESIKEFISKAMDPDNGDPALVRLMITVAKALAKQNDMSMLPVIVYLATHELPDWGGDEKALQEEAATSLKYFSDQHLFKLLQSLKKSPLSAIRYSVVTALKYLGTRDAVLELLEYLNDESSEISAHALNSILSIVGNISEARTFVDKKAFEEFQALIKKQIANYSDGICYRMGKPFEISTIIDQMHATSQISPLIDELTVVTGENFGYDLFTPTEDPKLIIARAQKWLKFNTKKYPSGSLIKNGFEQKN